MPSFKSSLRIARCILIVSLALGFIWPLPAVSQAQPAAARAVSIAEAPSVDPANVSNPIVAAAPVTPTIQVEGSGPIVSPQPIGPTAPPSPHTIHLKSGDLQPGAVEVLALNQLARSDGGRLHVLLQLDFIPREAAKAEYEKSGVKLLAYVPDYAWIASVPAADPAAVLNLPGVTWAAPLTVNDKLDPSIINGAWLPSNLAPDGTAAVSVITHLDEEVATTRALVEKYGGRITGEVIGLKMLMVEMPQPNIRALAAEEPIQWIEPAAPPLGPNNDGIRQQIGVDTLQAAPYNLDGTNIDVLVYDSGQVGDHTDFGARLTHGDADTVSEHSTHVAGTVGGSGANSAAQGGTALQWRGMAPAVDLISFGTNYTGVGPIFYQNVPDIESDFAAAQNTYGADLGTASVGSNVYANYPLSCTLLMGKYGASDVLIDQIIRGGNAVVGVGDKYIATWAVGNERNNTGSCSNTYSSIAPPAAAKNPIHVGASNTNNNSMTSFSSWGPTQDGRLKPIVVAGGCQSTGDGGIKSTDNSPVNAYTVMCGTSMATPAVGGSIALMLQHYRTVYGTSGNFWPSTAKAILMQTAVDFGNPGPDYQWGFGQVRIQQAVDLISRRAFRQDNVAQGSTDVFYLIVPTNTTPLQLSLAWDDFEATFNANPTLINNLDLELEAPSGTIWRPWILNPASPANNATRGVNSVDNQEQTTVPSPEIGTWIVRVKGTTVPQGPQDYALACEGCKPLDAGVCQNKVSTTAQSVPALFESESGALGSARRATVPEAITAGEQWQRSLEQPIGDQQPDRQMQLIEQARTQGDEAVVELGATLTSEARDRAMDDIVAAQQRLRDAAPPPPETRPISTAEEQARLAADQLAVIANREQALTLFDDPNENTGRSPVQVDYSPSGPSADRTVGNGCTYATIAAAITASSPGDRLLIEGGRTFTENVTINKNLTLRGGYNGCASGSTARTTVNGNASGIVMQITLAPTMTAALENLNVTNGNSSQGGIRLEVNSGGLTLNQVDIYSNTAIYGGGLWIGSNAIVTGTYVNIYNNTASDYGGGVRLYGGRATFRDSNIYNNTAPLGAGVYGDLQNANAPVLNLPYWADVHSNHSTTGGGLGGGLYLRQGSVSLADCSDIYGNNAINGGGAYLITSTLTINGSCSEIESNTANAHGGGVYAQDSIIALQDQVELYNNTAGATTTANGGGAYLDHSNLYSYRSAIYYNTTSYDGGGVYAVNGSIVDMELGGYPCTGPDCSQLSYNDGDSSVGYGGAIRADNSSVYLYNTFVENNTAQLGGGLYLYDNTTAYVYNSLFARNNAAGSTGDGIRLNTASLSGTNNTFAYNKAGGAATGHAIDLVSSSASQSCSIVWGHASSLNVAGQNVTYSDIQGGYGNSTNLNVDPLFVAAGSQDYHLQTGSPVIDRCVSGQANDFEGEPRPIARTASAALYDMGADEVSGIDRVGLNSTCTYGTIQQAVNAANDGDTIRVAAGVYFENVGITAGKVITIEGGYNNTCAATGAGTTRIEGSARDDSTFGILGGTTRLRNLQVAWGSGGSGGGMWTDGSAQVTLDNVAVFNNHGDYGGGIWLNTGSAVTLTNGATVHDNTATVLGGGVRTWGKFYGYGTTSDTYNNCAPDGGGFSVPGGQVYLDNADVIANQAAGTTGKGGGFYIEGGGVVTLTNSVFVGEAAPQMNTAYDGGGIYVDNSTVNLAGTATTVMNNTASHQGGGAFLINHGLLQSTGANIGHGGLAAWGNDAQLGAGIYAMTSTIDFVGTILNNMATGDGGGILSNNTQLLLQHAILQRNVADRGGAIYQDGAGAVGQINNTLIYSNTSLGNLGAGIRSANGALTLTHVTLANNFNGAGYSQGGGSGSADNSIAWGNTNATGGMIIFGGTFTYTCNIVEGGVYGINVNPLFVAPGVGENYHVPSFSPAVDACPTGLPYDLEYHLRPLFLRYDMGAYEYVPFMVRLPIVLKN